MSPRHMSTLPKRTFLTVISVEDRMKAEKERQMAYLDQALTKQKIKWEQARKMAEEMIAEEEGAHMRSQFAGASPT